jgi:hypothetical protein
LKIATEGYLSQITHPSTVALVVLLNMFVPNTFRLAGRRLATNTSRRAFSATVSSTARNDNARTTFMVAAAALSVVAVVRHQEVSRTSRKIRDSGTKVLAV